MPKGDTPSSGQFGKLEARGRKYSPSETDIVRCRKSLCENTKKPEFDNMFCSEQCAKEFSKAAKQGFKMKKFFRGF